MLSLSMIVEVLYVLVFFAAVFISLKFQWGKEANDERGKFILNSSYAISFPLLLLGWLMIELYHDYLNPLSYEQYRLAIWFLVTGLIILHALSLLILRRRM
jgi:peptidoglycan/LPS O-acetylase OafA/YrhL